MLDTLSQIDDAIDTDADLADSILDVGLQSMGIEATSPHIGSQPWHDTAKPEDHSKAHSTIRQFYRDWTAEGYQREVKPILHLILNDLHQHNLPPSPNMTILLPGAGLGRLLFELTLNGYHTTGNEISYHQLLASNFILNHTPHANSHTIHPFLSTFTNNITRTSQSSAYTIPDVHPSTALATSKSPVGSMSMTAGDFIPTYSTPSETNTFSVVITVFFIDTAPNLFRYISTIHNVLKPGGLWINIGPLLWHFDNRDPRQHNSLGTDDDGIAAPGSFELSNDEVLMLVEKIGFKIEGSESLDLQRYGNYIQDGESMVQNLYRPVHWVAKKMG